MAKVPNAPTPWRKGTAGQGMEMQSEGTTWELRGKLSLSLRHTMTCYIATGALTGISEETVNVPILSLCALSSVPKCICTLLSADSC